jgi:hypothetical protein
VTDDATLGGYLASHQRPPAFGGTDGRAYSVAAFVDDRPDAQGRFGAALLFVRWSDAGDVPAGHVETDYVVFGATPAEAEHRLHALSLSDVKVHLDRAIAARAGSPDW